MSSCEKCWRDAHRDPYLSVPDEYQRLVKSRYCTPEEQAGPDARPCALCGGRLTLHQHTGECMADASHTPEWRTR